MANTEMSVQTPVKSHGTGNGWRSLFFALVLVFVLAAAGWWALQSGLLSQYLGQGVSAGTTAAATGQAAVDTTAAQPGQMPQPGQLPAVGQMPQAGQMPGAGTAAAPPQAPPARTASDGRVADSAAAQAADADATESAGGVTASAARATLPVLGGVQGAPVWSDAGALVTGLGSGTVAHAVGRSADGAWFAVETERGAGWVLAAQVIAYGTKDLPVGELPVAVAAKARETADAVGASDAVTATVPEAPAGDATLAGTVATAAARLNLRAGPGAGYAVVARAEPGAAVTVGARSAAGDWLLVQLGSGEIGWAAADYLQVEGDSTTLPLSSAALDAEPLPGSAAASESTGAAAAAAPPAVTSAVPAATGLSGTLVFQDNRGGTIWVYELESGELRALTTGSDPAFSPDGSTVAFVRDGGESGLYLIGTDGSSERRIFERVDLSSPKWSPDGQWVLFARGDEIQECYEMGPNQCLTYSELVARFPGGVPDNITAPLVKKQLYHLSAVDTGGNNFHDIPATLAARAPDWSEGGIVYQSGGSLQRTADATGDPNQALLADSLNPAYYDPDWQPDGGQIVFQYKGAAQWDLYAVNADGSGVGALTRPTTTLVDKLPSNVAPAYSPDGQHVVFLSNRTDGGEAGAWRLWVMDAGGGSQRALPVDVEINYNFGAEQVVSWGP